MNAKANIDELFERRITYPDFAPRDRLAALVGLDDHKARLTKILALLVNPTGLETWARKHHPKMNGLLKTILRRPPLVVLAGDVGSGKTELAETIGDPVARQEGIDITLFPLSLSTRGQGRVGEMTQLLSAASSIPSPRPASSRVPPARPVAGSFFSSTRRMRLRNRARTRRCTTKTAPA
jgi:hypothetical protein